MQIRHLFIGRNLNRLCKHNSVDRCPMMEVAKICGTGDSCAIVYIRPALT